MNEDRLYRLVAQIQPADEAAKKDAKKRLDGIAKPLNSLGRFEDAIVKIAGIKGTHDYTLEKKALVIMCADNGVVEEGVTQTGREVTAIVTDNFLHDMTTVAVMAKGAGVDVVPVDVGVCTDTSVINRKVMYGTNNMTKGPAMTRAQALEAIMAGIDMVYELKEKGYDIIATGEMGIGNTTTSSAVCAVLLNADVADVTGRGAGLSDEGLKRKINAIQRAIDINGIDRDDPVDVVAKVGGLDIAGLMGVFLGGAIYGVPIVIDGFISSVSALLAVRMNKKVLDYIIPSHSSGEVAANMVMRELTLDTFLSCNMCLGEGTGAVMLMPLLDIVMKVYTDMSTFDDIKVEAYTPQ